MTDEAGVVRKRRTAAEVEQIVNEFEGSGLGKLGKLGETELGKLGETGDSRAPG